MYIVFDWLKDIVLFLISFVLCFWKEFYIFWEYGLVKIKVRFGFFSLLLLKCGLILLLLWDKLVFSCRDIWLMVGVVVGGISIWELVWFFNFFLCDCCCFCDVFGGESMLCMFKEVFGGGGGEKIMCLCFLLLVIIIGRSCKFWMFGDFCFFFGKDFVILGWICCCFLCIKFFLFYLNKVFVCRGVYVSLKLGFVDDFGMMRLGMEFLGFFVLLYVFVREFCVFCCFRKMFLENVLVFFFDILIYCK